MYQDEYIKVIEKDPDGTRGKEAMDMEECNDKNPHTFRVLKGKHVNEMKTKLISYKPLLTCSNR